MLFQDLGFNCKIQSNLSNPDAKKKGFSFRITSGFFRIKTKAQSF
jgi:hypothetical protein